MKFVSIDEAVASCSSVIKNVTREDRLIMKFWIWLGEKHIGCAKPNIKVSSIDVVDLSAQKPDDHLSTIDIALIDNDGNDRTYQYRGYNERIHPTSAHNNPAEVDVYEDEYCIHLSSDADYIDRVVVKYWSYPIDENCDPLIPESHIYALMQFVRYMYYIREEKHPTIINEASTEWKIQAAKARAENKMPDIPEAREILKSWMTMIPQNWELDYNLY